MSAEVARLRPEEASEPAPALGMSIQVDLGAGRIATLQTHIASDCTLMSLNALLDKMTAAGDRQRAHYKLEELHRDLLKQEKDKSQFQIDADAHKAAFNVAQEQRAAKIRHQEKILGDYISAKAEQRGEGRRSAVTLKGADAANQARLEAAVVEVKKAIVDADEAHAVEQANYEAGLKGHDQTIARTKREIERHEAIVKAASGE